MSLFSNAWAVFLLFSIPIGGGIPAGVLLAQSRGLTWPVMTLLYLLSDIVLACWFEPMVKLMVLGGKRSPFLARFNQALKQSMQQTISKYGINPHPFTLIVVAFGVDPMTGRTAALAAGHGFISGWTLAILGDMIFFSVLMASTLWLHHILGDGTWTAVIIMVLMIGVPALVKKIRNRGKDATSLRS